MRVSLSPRGPQAQSAGITLAGIALTGLALAGVSHAAVGGSPLPPDCAQPIGTAATPGPVEYLYLEGNSYCLAATQQSLQVFAVFNPAAPSEVGSWTPPAGSVVRGIDVFGPTLLAAYGGGFGTFSFFALTPDWQVTLPSHEEAIGAAIEGQFAVIAVDGASPELRVHSIFTGSLLGAVGLPDADVMEYWTYAYVAGDSVLSVVTIDQPDAPAVLGTLTPASGGAWGGVAWSAQDVAIDISARVLYLATDQGVLAVDVHDPAHPTALNPPGSTPACHAVAVADSKLYAMTAEGLRVYDASLPSDLLQIGFQALTGPSLGAANSQAYVGGAAGVSILDASGCAPAAFPAFCGSDDLALAACPCGNAGGLAGGCDVPQGTGGVALDVLARETSPENRATLRGTGFPTSGSAPALVIRSAAREPSPMAFGDGLLCLANPVVRLSAGFASGGVSSHTVGHGAQAGSGRFYYQLWFRSAPAMFCTPSAFNLSSGRVIAW